ncbi:hypothetical protein DSO57_1038267 [Entomophthora muscae]|uniref:Uncharacterized protein n=1 Tax=Entomophthora muscae TaxID=34485 RepID=A0ACC2T9N3_9FUNG|nr:hypothetical protein DSO57_1038267 [Entomophthora muscae]
MMINSCPSEEGQIQGSDAVEYSDSPEDEKIQVPKLKNNSPSDQWASRDQITCLGPDPSKTKPPKTKIELGNSMNFQHHLTSLPGKIIGSRQEWPNPQQIVREQEFDHLLKPQFPITLSKLFGSPSLASIPTCKVFQVGSTINRRPSVIACAIIEINTVKSEAVVFSLRVPSSLGIGLCFAPVSVFVSEGLCWAQPRVWRSSSSVVLGCLFFLSISVALLFCSL